ncbi:zinc dependent phospholipase C family protein [Lachnobacterium bovis]|uniref:Zinc dependent phospholipase C n=1 Tax=Lachnobacterium bovis TaxID=140626 RepID=A0A1H9RUP5_9FIRM|nr:zinc dependent phospholipase C family protein [Lachnobacterium bovis]SER76651.1 Zinc dependent phospholipase C [Lachnobacterium bovis]
MPGFTTHYLFGSDLFKLLPENSLKKNIRKNHSAYSLGLQGPDIFFFYIPSHIFHKENLGALAQDKKTGAFFLNLLESRTLFTGNKKHLQIADAYIMGFIGHYTLDTTCHPFIYAFTNYTPDSPPKDTHYFGNHAYLETEIDNSMLKYKKHIRPNQFHQDSTIMVSPTQRRVIAKMLCHAFKNTYTNLMVNKAMMRAAITYSIIGSRLLSDPTGQKKVFIRLIEQNLIGKAFISPMLPSDKYYFFKDPLNTRHKPWTHPWLRNKKSRKSFLNLYNYALAVFLKRLRGYYKLVHTDFSEEKRIFYSKHYYGNLSFLSGLPLED